VCQSIRVLVEAEPDISVVGEADNGRQAVQLMTKLQPDVVVMDLAMPQLNGLETTRQIMKQSPNAKVLVHSSYSDSEYVQQVTEAGATGYLIKQTAAEDLIKAVREASKGNACFSPKVCRGLVDNYRGAAGRGAAPAKRSVSLTTREAEVLQLIAAEGQPNKMIAYELGINIKTVEKHRQQLMCKLNIHDIAGLTRYANSKGVIETGSIGGHLSLAGPEKPSAKGRLLKTGESGASRIRADGCPSAELKMAKTAALNAAGSFAQAATLRVGWDRQGLKFGSLFGNRFWPRQQNLWVDSSGSGSRPNV
jgi:DNA-binding NarL/FixJ family response regulator